MKSTEFLTELMDQPVSYNISQSYGDYQANFSVGESEIEMSLITSDLVYGSQLDEHVPVVQIEFDDDNSPNASYKLSNRGNSIAIFSTIIRILKQFHKKKRPTFYVYEADKGSDKARLYQKLADKFFGGLGIVKIDAKRFDRLMYKSTGGELAYNADHVAIFTTPDRYHKNQERWRLPNLEDVI